MILDLLVILIALGVWFDRREPWQLLARIAVAFLVFLWLVRAYAPALVRL